MRFNNPTCCTFLGIGIEVAGRERGGPAAKISATLFSADEIFEIFGKICSIMVEIIEIFVVNWHIFLDNAQFFIILLSLKQDHTINLVTSLGQCHILSVF